MFAAMVGFNPAAVLGDEGVGSDFALAFAADVPADQAFRVAVAVFRGFKLRCLEIQSG